MKDEKLERLSRICASFEDEDEFLSLGSRGDELFLVANREKDPRGLMSVMELMLEHDEWLQMVVTGAMTGLMAADEKFRARFMAIFATMFETRPKKGN